MARVYDVVCLKCGEVMYWCKYDPPFERCLLCRTRLSKRGDWLEENARVFGVWSTGDEVYELSRRIRIAFFEENGNYKFRLRDGRLCTVELKEFPEFRVTLRTGGRKVSLIYDNKWLWEAVHLLRNYNLISASGLKAVEYCGSVYSPQHDTVKKIREAIKKNIEPEIATLVYA